MPLPSPPISGTTGGLASGGGGYVSELVDLNVVGAYTSSLALGDRNTAMYQVTLDTGAVVSFQTNLYGTIDNVKWIALGKTATSEGVTTFQNVTQYRFLRVQVDTPNSAALIARISILAKSTSLAP